MRNFGRLLACAAAVSGAAMAAPPAPTGGCTSCFRHLPPELVRIPGTGRLKKRLIRDFYFIDAAGLVWKADKGDVTDGASIPTIFLTLTGPRFEPDFLPAAVIHDHYTDDRHKVRTWRATARVFYDAMRANGTPAVKAKLMYYAVFAFGPHWGTLAPGAPCGPNCINLTSTTPARDRELRSRGYLVHPASSVGAQFFSEPGHGSPSDLPEMKAVKERIRAAENTGRPLGLDDLEAEAARRHPDDAFVAAAAEGQGQ